MRALLVLVILAASPPALGAKVAVGVSAGWSARSSLLGAFLRYELWYRHSAVFQKGAKHHLYPRSYGLGTRVARARRELIIKVPSLKKKATTVMLLVTVRQRVKVRRLLRGSKKWKWLPVKGWKKRKLVIDLQKAAVAVTISRAAARQEIKECLQKLRAYKKKHPRLGGVLLRAFEKTLDVSEEKIAGMIKGMVEARYMASEILDVLKARGVLETSPAGQPAEAPPRAP